MIVRMACAVAAGLLALGLGAPGARAQGSTQPSATVAVLTQAARSLETVKAFVLPELAKGGFVAGSNLTIVTRVANRETIDREAEALAAQKPSVLFAIGPDAARAVQRASRTIPIVFFGGQDVVAQGLAPSLTGSGTNVTGVLILSGELDVKRVELLADAMPQARRYAVLLYTGGNNFDSEAGIRAAAQRLGKEVLVRRAQRPADYADAFKAFAEWQADALVLGAAAPFFGDAELLLGMARAARLPTVCEWAEMTKLGCVLGYGPNRPLLYAAAARKLLQVLKGTPPRDLPIEQPAVFEFAVNAREARALSIELPATIIARADDIIE